jgi:hypothetical protein
MICTTVPAGAVVDGESVNPAVTIAIVSVVVWDTQHLIANPEVVGVDVLLHVIGWVAAVLIGVVISCGALVSAVAHVPEQDPVESSVQFVERVIRG